MEEMIVACNCLIKENISTEISPINYQKAKEISLMDSNIGVLKCYDLVFSFNGKLSNIGFWIFTILLIIYIIILIFYFSHGIKSIVDYIFNEMADYGYLKKSDKKFFEKNNNLDKNEKMSHKKIKRKMKKKKSNKTISNPVKKNNMQNNGDNNNVSLKRHNKRKNKRLNSKNDNSSSNFNSIQKINTKDKIILNQLINYPKSDKVLNDKHKYKTKNNKKMSYIPTEDLNKEKKKEKKDKNLINHCIIKINLNDIKKYYPQDSNQTLHNYTFEEAIQNDRRSIFKIYYIYLLSKQILFHTFLQRSPLELFSLRLCLFTFMISTDLALNSLLYLNDNISKKYRYTKNLFLFAFSDNITVIILSTLLSFILISLIRKLCNSTNAIRNVFRKEEEKLKNNKKYKIDEKRKKEIFLEIEEILKRLKIKIIFLIIIEVILMLFFWYFVTAFCHVYSSTQKSWLIDNFFSILSRLVIELLFGLLFAKLYIVSVESNCYTLYRFLLFIYDFS